MRVVTAPVSLPDGTTGEQRSSCRQVSACMSVRSHDAPAQLTLFNSAGATSSSPMCTCTVPLLPKRVASAAVQLLAKALGRVSRDASKRPPAAVHGPGAVGGKPLLGRDSGPKARTRDMEQRILVDVLRRAAAPQAATRIRRTTMTGNKAAAVPIEPADE